MKNKILTTVALLFSATIASSAPLTPTQALERISGQKLGKLRAASPATLTLTHSIADSNGCNALYVFNQAQRKGFVILSADDISTPILGYSDSDNFDNTDVPPQLESWLGEYARQIEYARENNVDFYIGAQTWEEEWDEIAPLVESKWNQDAPFNNLCPSVNGEKSYTGCVATAMSQVMNYWKYPESGSGTVSYRPTFIREDLELNFAELKFDWDNMLDEYTRNSYSSKEADAVATLMKAAGYSVFMDYSPQSSGAMSLYIRKALIENFRYNNDIQYVERAYFSSSEWTKIIYESLKNSGPVIYNGQGSVGGHSFVCDGYSDEGFFHINWGWGGKSDGYFRLEAMNPEYIGIGGFNGGFNFTQDAVINIQKPGNDPGEFVKDELRLSQYGSLTAFVEKDRLKFGVKDYSPLGWLNNNPEQFNFSMGFLFQPVESEEASTFLIESVNMLNKVLEPGAYIQYKKDDKIIFSPYLTISKLDIPDGKYKVTLAAIDLKDENADWLPVRAPYGCHDNLIIEIKGEEINIYEYDTASATVEAISTNSGFYYNCPSSITCSMVNNTDIQTTQSLAPALIDNNGEIAYFGESIFFILNPGEKIIYQWKSVLKDKIILNPKEDVEYKLVIYDSSYNRFLTDGNDRIITMHPYPGLPKVTAEMSSPDNTILNINGKDTHIIGENSPGFNLQCEININEGVFSYPLYINIIEETGNTSKTVSNYYGDFAYLREGETKLFDFNIDTEDLNVNRSYCVKISHPTVEGDLWLNDSLYFMIGENNSVGCLDGDPIEIKHDKKLGIIHLYGADTSCSPELFCADGSRLNTEIIPGINSIDVKYKVSQKLAILKYIDQNGVIRSVKIYL